MLSKLRVNFFSRFDVKLTIFYTFALLLISLILSSFFYYRLQHNLLKQIDRILKDEAKELILEIEEDNHVVKGCKEFFGDISYRVFYPVFFRVMTHDGVTLWESENFSTILSKGIKGREHFTVTVDHRKKKRYRIYEKRFTFNDQGPFVAQMATNTKRSDKILENSLLNIFSAIPVVFLLSLCFGMYISQKPRKTLRNITAVTKKITSQNLAERLPLPPGQDEIRDLTLTINFMLDNIESSFDEVRQFTADVSHELRNPLSAVKGEIEVAVSRKRDAADYLETLHNCLERIDDLIKMVNDLFLISCFDAKKYDLKLSRINLAELLGEMYDFFLPIAQEKNIQFVIERCDTVFASVDRHKILQLLSNLMDNAVKFTPENQSITLSLIEHSHEVELDVSDSGIGIPEGNLENIFKRFYQVDPSRSGDERGAGLGLHICKRIAEVHGGSIAATRNTTKGVTFTVRLPLN
ncbi:MAG: HAMP domain-containing protein [Deltaproteobacteria bacterium]|nr:HAMP domain-containing protein [Deltaproteobacteria bacterium]MBW2013781.1 HAMP domain-containing protein [Deltaproteobacteria bacterium]MBW2088111.1 HAMP domain-containing protein [Deltaproteobacteria bacterium]